ncbi:helix-turn-helix domain-containing protein [Saliphagus sp. GCM10025334]
MAEFFREPNREKLREILRNYDGEYDNLDFKKEWIDNAKLGKHVLALANSGGGVILFGISEKEDNTLEIKGLENLKDKSDLSIDQYLPDEAHEIYEVEEYVYASAEWSELEGKLFQVLFVDDVPEILPLISQKGKQGRISRDRIYIRKNTKSIEAGQSGINNIIDRRVKSQLETKSDDIREDLSQLKALYDNGENNGIRIKSNMKKLLQPGKRDEFYQYIDSRIAAKEKQIDEKLGLEIDDAPATLKETVKRYKR